MARRTFPAAVIAAVLMTASAAQAEQKRCDPGSEAKCPEFTAPATTAVPGPAIDGSIFLTSTYVQGTSVTLFGGTTPPNGFMISATSGGFGFCWVNDNGPANSNAGFILTITGQASDNNGSHVPAVPPFVTPPGYKPMGPVSIACGINPVFVEARGW